jgi:OmcA/MtrC family decaheme c-type cytochrome
MRRITLALALVGAVAAGCSGGAGSTASSNNQKRGVTGSTFTLTVRGEFLDPVSGKIVPAGGVVTSVPAGIDCGMPAAGAAHTACSFDFTYDAVNPVAINAANDTVGGVQAFAGACSGQAACSILMTSDQLLLVRFAANTAALGGHPNFSDPAIHIPEYNKWAANDPTAYHCTDCHGAQGQGAGLAPSCGQCHAVPQLPPAPLLPPSTQKTGLVATVNSITLTSPITVSFSLKDGAGNAVDISNAATANLPISNCGHGSSTPSVGCSNTTIGFALGYFSVGANSYNASGIVSPYTIYTVSSGSPTMLSPTKMGDNTTKGVLTQVSTGNYTYAFPTTVVLDATKLANTHTFFMYATRQEDVSGGACTGPGPFTACPSQADNNKKYTAVNVIWNFDATSGAAVTAKREIVNPAGCNKCHDGFRPTGLVSAAFHSGNKVDGRICNVCHNPARTSNQWANSAQYIHRIHQYAEAMTSMPYVCVDEQTAATGTQPTPGQWTPLSFTGGVAGYAGGGTAAVIPASATDTSICNATNFPAPYLPVVVATAFDNTGLDLTYPQDIRNCDQCHGGAAQGAQWNTNASPVACDSCHANNFGYWYGTQAAVDSEMNTGGSFIPGFVAGSNAANIQMAHPRLAVSSPDPQGCLLQNGAQPAGCNGNTNASYLANAGQVPVNADTWTYDITNVQLDTNGHPQVTFALKKNGVATAFDFCNAITAASQTDKTVLFNGTFGGPSIYAAYSVAEDGITTPADFNSTVSGYLPAICNEGKTSFGGSSAATIVKAATTGYYTVTFTYTTNLISKGISMLTGGVGYTYNPSSTPPLTQTSVMGPFGVQYKVTTYNVTSGTIYGVACTGAAPCATKTGGLIVPIKNVTMVAPGYTGRRVVVANAACDNCHARLGAKPTFHAGQRNDAPTCNFCHHGNQGSGGWSADASTFVHAIHGTNKRTVDFTWEGSCNIGATWTVKGTPSAPNPPTTYYLNGDCIDNVTHLVVAPRFYYPEVTYPGALSCSECHTSGFFAQTQAAGTNLLWSTTAYGTTAYGNNPNTSPYVNPTTVYGAGFSFSATTGVTAAAAGTTLVNSPIASACFSCHDDPTTVNPLIGSDAVSHMKAMGGHLYEARSTAMANLGSEGCMGCHGPGQVYDIAKVHQ